MTDATAELRGRAGLQATAALGPLCRHELKMLLYATPTYIFQAGMLLALSVAIFLIADYYSSDHASVEPLLTFLPWVALVFVPALGMRAWTEGPSDRALELLLTLPTSPATLVGGKFLAGTTVLILTLAFTVALPATAAYLGDPDPGAALAVYIAAACLLCVYYSASLFAASMAREPVAAFVIGIVILFLMLVPGWDVLQRLLHHRAPAGMLELIRAMSPKTWVDQIGFGTLQLGAVFQFAAQTAIFLVAAGAVIRLRGQPSSGPIRSKHAGLVLACVLVASLASGAVALQIPGQLDLTEEREFTQHQGTRALVTRTPAGTVIELYWSASEVDVPAAIRAHARRARILMEMIAEQSDGRIAFRVIDPAPDTDDELKALWSGIQRVPLSSGGYFYLGAAFRNGDRLGRISYLDIRRDRFLEYDIAVALSSLGKERLPRIGILSPLLPSPTAYREREGLTFVAELRRSYDIAFIPFFSDTVPQGLDAVIVLQPSVLKKEMLYALDQFVLDGGGLILTLDPFVRFDPASNQLRFEPSTHVDDASDLVAAYGARYLGERVVGDVDLASPAVDRNQMELSYPFWMRFPAQRVSSDHVVTTSLNEVFFVEPGAFEITDPERAAAMIETTARSGTLDRNLFRREEPRILASRLEVDGVSRPIAVMISGMLESAFPGAPEFADAGKHHERSVRPSRVFAIADSDWLFDPFSLQKLDVGGQVMVRPLNDNLTLLLNMTEYLTGDPELISIRTRGRLQRPFTRVEELFKSAQAEYREREQEIARRIESLERRLPGPSAAQESESSTTPASELAGQASEAQLALLSARKDLRDIRRRIREGVEALGRRVMIVNILAGPMLVIALAVAIRAFRGRRLRRFAPIRRTT